MKKLASWALVIVAFQGTCAACHGVELTGTETGPPLIYVAYWTAFHLPNG